MNRDHRQLPRFLSRLVSPINNFLTKRQYLTRKEKRNQNIFLTFCTIFGIVVCSLFVRIGYCMYLTNDLEQESTTLATEQQKLTDQKVDLKRDVKLLKDDDYVLKLARQRFLLSKDGEVVFSIIDDQDAAANAVYVENAIPQETEESTTEKTTNSTATTSSSVATNNVENNY